MKKSNETIYMIACVVYVYPFRSISICVWDIGMHIIKVYTRIYTTTNMSNEVKNRIALKCKKSVYLPACEVVACYFFVYDANAHSNMR